jgi:hypothetical protein
MTDVLINDTCFHDGYTRRYLPMACISPLYCELSNALVDVFSRPIVQDRVAGQSLETGVARPRLTAGGRGAG